MSTQGWIVLVCIFIYMLVLVIGTVLSQDVRKSISGGGWILIVLWFLLLLLYGLWQLWGIDCAVRGVDNGWACGVYAWIATTFIILATIPMVIALIMLAFVKPEEKEEVPDNHSTDINSESR